MSEIELPSRLIAAGEELWGDRVNVYQKTEIIKVLADALTDEEMKFLRESPFSKLLDIPSLPSWSGSFGIFLMSRQLVILKENEMWILFAGSPIRFSLREFKIVTGLPCGKLPVAEKKKRKGKGKSVEEESYFTTLFDTDKDDVSVERVLIMLKEKIVTDEEIRKRLACLVLVDGILVPTTHFPKCKVLVEQFTVERIVGLPQVSVTAQSGLMTLFFIQAHACGGLDAVKEFDVTNLEYESKRLVGSLIDTFT